MGQQDSGKIRSGLTDPQEEEDLLPVVSSSFFFYVFSSRFHVLSPFFYALPYSPSFYPE